MGRKFNIPIFYRSPVISSLKRTRSELDLRKKDLSPTGIDFGPVSFKLARHFGFCFGVENAIEIAYRAVEENPTKRVFLLSEMIHNTHVNSDLESRGVRFILDPKGDQQIPFEELRPDDIVIVPAFGTTVELFEKLESLGINPKLYNATCPFVEKVWKRAAQLGGQGYTVIIHGKHSHEETRATFSHAHLDAPTVVIRDVVEAELLCRYIRKELPLLQFFEDFSGRYSNGFDPDAHLTRVGVVNQTTMLATETQHISALIRDAVAARFGAQQVTDHFADTRDTLCYATSENQDAVHALIRSGGDIAIVVGGYNSSNTSHLVEICEEHVPTFYIKDASEILDVNSVRHLNFRTGEISVTSPWLPAKRPLTILVTAGASCPDALVEEVISKVAALCGCEKTLESLAP